MSVIFFLTFFTLAAYGQEGDPSCEKSLLSSDLENIATSFQIPNCTRRKNINDANKGEFAKLCQNCKPHFDKSVKIHANLKFKKNSINLEKVLIDELKRSLSAQLLNIVNLRSVFSPQADFSEAISACDLNAMETRLKQQNCASNSSLSELKNQMGEELGHLLNSRPHFDNKGLLNRKNSKSSCNISDVSILRAKSLLLEESLDEEMVNEILSIKANEKHEFEIDLSNIGQKRKFPLTSSFSAHPLFSQLLTPPESMMNFFKGLSRPVKTENLRASMYTHKESNDAMVKTIAHRCQTSFATFEELACHPDIKAGKVRINSLKDSAFFMPATKPVNNNFVNLELPQQLQDNIDLLNICEIRSDSEDSLDFNHKVSVMNAWMPTEDSSVPYENYRANKYENEFGSIRNALCKYEKNKMECNKEDYTCRLYQILKKEEDPSTPEHRLASSSDRNVNSLLRAFIGSPDELSLNTQSTLINAGILPKNAQGEFVTTDNVTERKPEYIQHLNSVANRPPQSSPQVMAPTQIQRPLTGAGATATVAPNLPSPGSSSAGTAETTQDLADADEPDMTSFNEEILRRLSQRSTPNGGPPSREKVREIVRDLSKSRKRPLTTAQEDAYVGSAFNAHRGYDGPPREERATITPGDTAKDKWGKEQKLRALSGMHGAQQGSERGAASTGTTQSAESGTPKEKLSIIAVSVSESNTASNLSDLLKEKILKKDNEGRILNDLIQKKKNFILQIKGISFNVQYDKATNSFQLSHARGDKAEANKIMPQLEVFFARSLS